MALWQGHPCPVDTFLFYFYTERSLHSCRYSMESLHWGSSTEYPLSAIHHNLFITRLLGSKVKTLLAKWWCCIQTKWSYFYIICTFFVSIQYLWGPSLNHLISEAFYKEDPVYVYWCKNDKTIFWILTLMEISWLLLSRNPRDSLEYFEISVPLHIRFAELKKTINQTTTFNKWICISTPEVKRYIENIVEKEQFLLFSTIFWYLLLDFHVGTGTRFSLRDKWLFEISEVEITRDYCMLWKLLQCQWHRVCLSIFRAELINPDWVELNQSRGYESYEHKLFMRYTGKGTYFQIGHLFETEKYWYHSYFCI